MHLGLLELLFSGNTLCFTILLSSSRRTIMCQICDCNSCLFFNALFVQYGLVVVFVVQPRRRSLRRPKQSHFTFSHAFDHFRSTISRAHQKPLPHHHGQQEEEEHASQAGRSCSQQPKEHQGEQRRAPDNIFWRDHLLFYYLGRVSSPPQWRTVVWLQLQGDW